MYFLFGLLLITVEPHEAHDGDGINFYLIFDSTSGILKPVWEEVVHKTDYYI
jgi:hypothetical protein